MTNYDKTFMLGAGQGSSQTTTNEYIIIHDTANDKNQGDNSAYNEASYMHNNWQNAYTHAIAGWDKVYLVGKPGYVAYGAGSVANSRAPFQIELAHYSDPTKQRQSYVNYINTIREYANKFGIPLTLDGVGKGIKSHKWVSDNIWGDHQDPYAYLARIGISKDQLAKDLANGVDGTVPSENSNSNSTIEGLEDDDYMKFTYEVKNKAGKSGGQYYFNGQKVIGLQHPDQAKIIRQIYKDTVGKDMKHYVWSESAPWHNRFMQANNITKIEMAGK